MGNDLSYNYTNFTKVLNFLNQFCNNMNRRDRDLITIDKLRFNKRRETGHYSEILSKGIKEVKGIEKVITGLILSTKFANYSHKFLELEIIKNIHQSFLTKGQINLKEGDYGDVIYFTEDVEVEFWQNGEFLGKEVCNVFGLGFLNGRTSDYTIRYDKQINIAYTINFRDLYRAFNRFMEFIFDCVFQENIFMKFFVNVFGETFQREMVNIGIIQKLNKGDVLYHQNESLMTFIFTLSGSVKLTKFIQKYNKRLDMMTLYSGDILSLCEICYGKTASYSSICTSENTLVLIFTKDVYKKYFQNLERKQRLVAILSARDIVLSSIYMKGIGGGEESDEKRKFEYASAESFGVKKYGMLNSSRKLFKKKRPVTRGSFVKKRDLWIDPKKLAKDSKLRNRWNKKKFSSIVDELISQSLNPKFRGKSLKNNFVNSSRGKQQGSFVRSYQEQPVRVVKVSRISKFTKQTPIHRSDKKLNRVLYTSNMKKKERKRLKSQRKKAFKENKNSRFKNYNSLFEPTPPKERPGGRKREGPAKNSRFHNSFVLKKSRQKTNSSMRKSKSAIKVNDYKARTTESGLGLVRASQETEPAEKRHIMKLIKRSFNIGRGGMSNQRDASKSSYVCNSSLEQHLVQKEQKQQRKKRWPVNPQKLLFNIVRSSNRSRKGRSKFIRTKRMSIGTGDSLRKSSHHFTKRVSLLSRKKRKAKRPHLALRLLKKVKKRLEGRRKQSSVESHDNDYKEYQLQQMMKSSLSPCKKSSKVDNQSQRYVNSFLVDCYKTR